MIAATMQRDPCILCQILLRDDRKKSVLCTNPHIQLRRELVHSHFLHLTLGAPHKPVEFLGIRQLRRTQPELPVSAPD